MDETEIPIAGGDEGQIALGDPLAAPAALEGDSPPGAASDGQERGKVRSQRTVPYGALAEERARRKELQRELQGTIESHQKLQGRLDLLHELAQQRGAVDADVGGETVLEPEGRPTRDDFPVESPTSVAEAQAQFRTQIMQSVRDAIREQPDFLAAYRHARQARVSELRALGYAPQEALAITFDNEAEIINNAYATGRNPAQIIYDYAQRHGYRGSSNGSRRDAGEIPPIRGGGMSEAEKVALAARGQAASKSLSAAGGGATGALTLEALAGLSDDEFAEATRGDRWQKLLKG
jgi:hypothetical protein